MLDPLAGRSPQSVGVEVRAHNARLAAIARLLLALICTAIFLCALATPYFAARLMG
jgi:hypothetical protein